MPQADLDPDLFRVPFFFDTYHPHILQQATEGSIPMEPQRAELVPAKGCSIQISAWPHNSLYTVRIFNQISKRQVAVRHFVSLYSLADVIKKLRRKWRKLLFEERYDERCVINPVCEPKDGRDGSAASLSRR